MQDSPHHFHPDHCTIFYRKRTPAHEILETLALLAEGSRISSLSRAKGFKEDTILAWLREAAHHAEQIEEVLMADSKVKRGQLDALWSYVGNKGEKTAIPRATQVASSGARPCSTCTAACGWHEG